MRRMIYCIIKMGEIYCNVSIKYLLNTIPDFLYWRKGFKEASLLDKFSSIG